MRQIHVESVQSWANELYNLEKYGEYLEQMPASVLFDFEAVYHGHATLVTPDGRQWWIPVRGTVDDTPAIDDSAAVLESYLIDHKVLARKLVLACRSCSLMPRPWIRQKRSAKTVTGGSI